MMRPLLTTAALLILCATQAFGVISYSNLGPGDAYDAGVAYTVGGSSTSNQGIASSFVAGSGGLLSSIRIALSYYAGDEGIVVRLKDDNAGNLGSTLAEWNFDTDSSSRLYTLSGAAVNLTAGTQYWINVERTSLDGWLGFHWNSTGDSGLNSFNTDGGAYSTFDGVKGAFEVNTDVVPEPVSMSLLGLGAAALVARRRRNGR